MTTRDSTGTARDLPEFQGTTPTPSPTKPRAIDLRAPGVPEDCLSIPGQGIAIDLTNTCLARAVGTIDVLMAAGDGDGFALDNTAIVNTLWGIRAWLEMARRALNPPVKIEGAP